LACRIGGSRKPTGLLFSLLLGRGQPLQPCARLDGICLQAVERIEEAIDVVRGL